MFLGWARIKKSTVYSQTMRLRLPGMPGSPNRKILRAAIVVGSLMLLVKLGGTLKELVVAGKFGRNDALDAFLIAYLLPSFIVALVAGAFSAALIPVFLETRQKNEADSAQKLFSSAMLLTAMVLAVTALVLGVTARWCLPYLALGFSPAKLQLTRELFYGLLPFLLFGGIAGCAAAALNAMESFALPAAIPLITPILTLLLITLGPAKWGAYLLVIGVGAGSILEAGLLAAALRQRGLRLSLSWYGFTPELGAFSHQVLPSLAGMLMASGTSVVDQSMAAMLPPGSVSALSYANKMVAAVAGIGGTALSTAAFPYLAGMVARADWRGCHHTLKRYSLLVIAAATPITAGLILFSRPLVKLVFQRGAFTGADTDLVSHIQVLYALQIPFFLAGTLYSRFLFSVRRSQILMYCALANLVLDIALNLLFMKLWGVAGIALSTSLVQVIACVVLGMLTARLLGQNLSAASMAARSGFFAADIGRNRS